MKKYYSAIALLFICQALFGTGNVLKVKITAPNNYSDESIVRFTQGATENFDGQFDAWKIFSNYSQVPSLWTEIPSGGPLSINTQPELNRDFTIDLFTWINYAGTHTITIEELGQFDNDVALYLYDKETTQLWEIKDGDSINLYFPQSIDSIARLQLIFSLPFTTTQVSEACNELGSVLVLSDIGMNFDYEIQDDQNNIVSSANSVVGIDTIFDLTTGNYDLYINYPYNLTEIHNISITGKSVTASIGLSNHTTTLSGGGEMVFQNNSSGAASYTWDFGDGNQSIEEAPVHNYAEAGNYFVTLTATNANCISQDEVKVEVIDDIQTGIANNNSIQGLKLYKNQHGQFIVNNQQVETLISIYTLDGKKTFEKRTTAQFEFLPLQKGVSIITAVNENEAIQSKVYK